MLRYSRLAVDREQTHCKWCFSATRLQSSRVPGVSLHKCVGIFLLSREGVAGERQQERRPTCSGSLSTSLRASKPFLLKSGGVSRADDGKVLCGINHVLRHGLGSRGCPSSFCTWSGKDVLWSFT